MNQSGPQFNGTALLCVGRPNQIAREGKQEKARLLIRITTLICEKVDLKKYKGELKKIWNSLSRIRKKPNIY